MRYKFLVMGLLPLASLLSIGCKAEIHDDRPGVHVDREADGDRKVEINTPRRHIDVDVDK